MLSLARSLVWTRVAHNGVSSVESGVGAGVGLYGCSRRGERGESCVGAGGGLSGWSRRSKSCGGAGGGLWVLTAE